MNKVKAYQLPITDLVLLNFWKPGIKTDCWVDQLWDMAVDVGELYCIDHDQTTCGDTDGISVLVQKDHQTKWLKAAETLGSTCKISDKPVTPGIYGDSEYSVRIASDGEYLYWMEF